MTTQTSSPQNGTIDVGADVRALGLLLGLLRTDGVDTVLDTGWFEDPLASLETLGERLQQLVTLVDSLLGPPLPTAPAAFTGARWYQLPDPTTGGPTPLFVVASDPGESSGRLGIGVLCSTQLGQLTIDVYAFVPIVSYGPAGHGPFGASLLVGDREDPCLLGLEVTAKDPFTLTEPGGSTVSFTAVTMEGQIYLADKIPTFSLDFANLTGTSKTGPFTSLSDLLDPDVDAWLLQVLVQSQN